MRLVMSSRRISWTAALRELKADRAVRSVIREERLRTSTGLRGAPTIAMSSWRGKSGHRYVVVVQPLDTVDLVVDDPAVVLTVGRDGQGQAILIAARACKAGDTGFLGWLAACAQLGAHELHSYRLAATHAERRAIVEDLGGPTAVTAAGAL
ncbi:hypothetical protein FV228_07285 [Methylobacterium sp. WL18]|nr:hypothetical protein FV228_07285 [Methylobacterium sp. WL18]